MEDIKLKLGKGGLILAAMGIISIILSIFNYNIRLLAWVDAWGNTMGWVIRILLILGGGALFLFFGREEDDEA
ncbi:hypothetical protein ACFO3O_06095 [Dokdonia ponticola]|uniref:Uncharacterized protein n=1 Tax=Dokdonia ponticola TaxID=2041041 RepID=A0ABV9HVC6_9FLAO